MEVVKYAVDYKLQHYVIPSLQRCGYSHQSYELVSSGSIVNNWTSYHCKVTAKNNEYDTVVVIATFIVSGRNYVDILNGTSGMVYKEVTPYVGGRQGRTETQLNGSQFEEYLKNLIR